MSRKLAVLGFAAVGLLAAPAAADCTGRPMTISTDFGKTYETCINSCGINNTWDSIGTATFSGPDAIVAQCLDLCRRTPGCRAVQYSLGWSWDRGNFVGCVMYGRGELNKSDVPGAYVTGVCYPVPPPNRATPRDLPQEVDLRIPKQDWSRPNVPGSGSPPHPYRGK